MLILIGDRILLTNLDFQLRNAKITRFWNRVLQKVFELNEGVATRIFGYSESLCSTDTYQFDDYSKYVTDGFDTAKKAKRREEVFPQDCEKVFEMEIRFIKRQKGIM